ncbi:GH116 family glycosyl hydrolase [Ruania zhangjianzhongii]|uniref:GH116 family glycosyl hydrolase n=1 Tax=Ruania zhangjianzhongii TaxID=2603206 RepID=UPI0011C9181C|nr:GH116 family glycosyl hydrolase [Ruania zhangjianzhongii]
MTAERAVVGTGTPAEGVKRAAEGAQQAAARAAEGAEPAVKRAQGAAARVERARTFGFTADQVPEAAFQAKPRSHDDGPQHGMLLGPIGGPAFGRDLTGHFSRWHLWPGTHLVADIEAAFLAVHWTSGGHHHHRVLRADQVVEHRTATLFPVSHETFRDPEMPFTVTLTAFSPVIPWDEDAAATPVVLFDVSAAPVPGQTELPALDVALFWPNLNGWQPAWVTAADRGDRSWPGQHHAGNYNVPAPPGHGLGVLQQRTPAPGMDSAGAVCVSVAGSADRFSRQVQFKTDQNATGVPPAEQEFTLGAVWQAFAGTGQLGTTADGSWPAHWHEPVGSAVAGHLDAGRPGAQVQFVLAFDWPTAGFGQGRTWWRRYAARGEGPGAAALAELAHTRADEWLAAIDGWHTSTLNRLTGRGWAPQVAGTVINELSLVTALGTAWVDGTIDGHDPGLDALLRRREHLGLLEGFDEGYFYFNTADLWHYAFPALSQNWPRLADVVFADLADGLAGTDPTERPVYRLNTHRRTLEPLRLPHDVGSAAEDPFVRLNGYTMRDDPNTWRDATPAHVLAQLTHARLTGRPLPDQRWCLLRSAAEQICGDQVPEHAEFGDSTWDNLALRGHSSYATSLLTGMWAVVAAEAQRRGEDATPLVARHERARAVLQSLWTGEHYRAASAGKYTGAVMPDSIWGLFYADLCGADTVARERIRGHLRAGYEICHRGYADGQVGPLLIGERDRTSRFDQDGGEELQVNEVLVGSAWMFTAMLRHFGLHAEADDVAGSLHRTLYGGTGLQFRTPAAVAAEGLFRAPLNLRPLAIWWLAATAR